MPPLCSRCGKNVANVHITTCVVESDSNRDAEVTGQLSLCEGCAAETKVINRRVRLGHVTGTTIRLRPASPEDKAFPFIDACLQAASSKSHSKRHVRADAILAVVPEVAKSLYGKNARKKLKDLGIEASEDFDKLIYWFIERGILCQTEGDKIEDFLVRSPLDDFLENG